MSENRSSRVGSSFAFKLLESVGNQGIAFVVSLVLARLLGPEDYGVLTMLTVFIAVSQVFVQSGLNTALIQKKDVDERDLSSVFWVSFGISVLLYGVLFAAAPWIASYYDMPALQSTLRVLALVLIPGAFLSVQNAVVARRMAFRRLMMCSLCATVISGATGIGMAAAGMGYWALVGQQLSNQLSLSVLLLFAVKWRPRLMFSARLVQGHLRFGWKLLVSSLLDTGFSNFRLSVVGKQFSSGMLGLFNRGKQFPELVMNAVNGSITTVMLPVLSEQQDDEARMRMLMRRSLMLSSFVVMPLMAGLAAVAQPMIALLLGEQWLPCVPFLQICCIDFALYPLHTTNLQVINAKGRSDIFLKLELIKKAYGLALLAVTVWCFDSVYAIAWGGVVSGVISVYINAFPSKKLVGYSVWAQVKDLLPIALISLIMFAAVSAVGMLAIHPALLLCVQAVCGVAVYAGLALIFGLESAKDLLKMLRRKESRS